MNTNRPTGVTVLSGLQFFYSGYGLLVSLAILLFKPFRDNLIQASMQMLKSSPELSNYPLVSADFFEGVIKAGAVGGIVFSSIGLLLGYGLLKLKKWAWICTLILQVFQILGGLQGIFSVIGARTVPGITISQHIFQLIVSGAIVYYLFRPEVKQSFGR